jgi:hypothetical protein
MDECAGGKDNSGEVEKVNAVREKKVVEKVSKVMKGSKGGDGEGGEGEGGESEKKGYEVKVVRVRVMRAKVETGEDGGGGG